MGPPVSVVKGSRFWRKWNSIERHLLPLASGNKTETNFIEIPSELKSLLVGGSGALAGMRIRMPLSAHFLLTF